MSKNKKTILPSNENSNRKDSIKALGFWVTMDDSFIDKKKSANEASYNYSIIDLGYSDPSDRLRLPEDSSSPEGVLMEGKLLSLTINTSNIYIEEIHHLFYQCDIAMVYVVFFFCEDTIQYFVDDNLFSTFGEVDITVNYDKHLNGEDAFKTYQKIKDHCTGLSFICNPPSFADHIEKKYRLPVKTIGSRELELQKKDYPTYV